MNVSIIILTYNSSKYIDELLQSLIKKYKGDIKSKQLEIIIADNASGDDTVKRASIYKEIKVLKTGGNFGYAKGNNIASKSASGDVLIFLNPDALYISGDILRLTNELKNENVGVVGGEILNYDGKRELSCGKFYNGFHTFLLSLGLEEFFGVRFAPSKRQKVQFVSGAFLAVRKRLFHELNGFDENYFMYIEDSDFCFRVKRAGYSTIFSPVATIKHIGQGSSNRTFAVINIYKGLLFFNKKYMSKFSYEFVKIILKTKAIVLVNYGKVSNNQYLVTTYEEALKAI
jgi:GT2 family glycosyltransferase